MAPEVVDQAEFDEMAFKLGVGSFNPSAPIDREDLFAGRMSQRRDILDAINQRGAHAVLYGERGVGKTSLANMIFPLMRLADPFSTIAAQINCITGDSYPGLWKRVFEEILFNGTNAAQYTIDKNVKKLLAEYSGPFADQITPDVVRRVLYGLGQKANVVIILDEFDTVGSSDIRAAISDTIKFISDRAVPATIILIGVADDVSSLIANHRSLERCLRQILMPRMSEVELQSIVLKGLNKVNMIIEKNALQTIAKISRGLPHYAHLLGLHSGRCALDKKTIAVSEKHVQCAIREAITKAQVSIQSEYSKAISSSRKDARYRQVLLACALAPTDDLGWFYPRDVRGPLERVLGVPWKIESFSRHLYAFCDPDHGSVLKSEVRTIRPRFRFDNPLLQPYVLINGLAQKLIAMTDLERLRELTPPDPEISQGSLFD